MATTLWHRHRRRIDGKGVLFRVAEQSVSIEEICLALPVAITPTVNVRDPAKLWQFIRPVEKV